MSGPIRVVVADDQQVMREGLVALLGLIDGIEVVGDAGDGEGALRATAERRPDVVLMDLRMPGTDGVAATERIGREHPGVAVLVLTTYDDDESIAAALRAGAHGYLTKDTGRDGIAAAVRAAAAGQAAFTPGVSRRLAEAMAVRGVAPEEARDEPEGAGGAEPVQEPPDGLTRREAEVVGLIARGLSNAEIGGTLFIAESTVKTHVNNAFAKTGLRNRTEAAAYARRNRLDR
ncbi:response regulator transcription factor [Nocardiopsis suaedae]|uniref:Response regulator transcription factor n=1 Tax=Nocardiopsis suaedae TaxID=3018444 RepID=A0ABT4TMQ0_9ACTN|nr:response regulator transcription factor [Nocardiopsis suaedae]MDA2805670.1 response regulator transcription factor [Nocardiopsis suaedae]